MRRIETFKFLGRHISDVVAEYLAVAKEEKQVIAFTFNDIEVEISPDDDLVTVVHRWERELKTMCEIAERKREEWAKTPEGIAHAKKEADEAAYAERILKEECGKLREFSVVDRTDWDMWVSKNQDAYGAAIFRYAARWAWMMEQEMSKGATVADCADATLRLADVEGVTGFMHGAAVSILKKCWTHGEEFGRWYDMKHALGRLPLTKGLTTNSAKKEEVKSDEEVPKEASGD